MTNDKRMLSKTKVESESEENKSVNLSDFGLAKNCQNPTTTLNSITS